MTQTGKLNERAMLVSLSIGTWEGRKKDRSVTATVTASAKAESDAGAWWTRVVPPKSLLEIHRAADKGRSLVYQLTLPWNDGGQRILPSAMFQQFTAEIRKAHEAFTNAVDDFLLKFPDLVKDAETRLGKLFDKNAFPAIKRLKRRFHWTVSFSPLPTAEDFRVNLGDEQTSEIVNQIKEQTEAQISTAMQSVWNRVYEGVNKIADKLGDPDAIFRDSLISNLTELCDVVPALNIADDPNLAQLRDMVVRKLTTTDPDILRSNKTVRADVAASATKILNKMKPFVATEDDA